MNTDTLTELIGRIAAHDKAAFSAVYRLLEKPVYRFIRSRLNDPFEAADILQEVFMEVWRGADKFEGRSSVKSWVFGIAYRKVMDVFRKTSRIDYSDDLPDQADEAVNAEECLLSTQNSAHIRHCLETLKPNHREVIELAFFEDLGYREIASVVGAPEGTVKTRVFHAKQGLLRCLQGRVTQEDI